MTAASVERAIDWIDRNRPAFASKPDEVLRCKRLSELALAGVSLRRAGRAIGRRWCDFAWAKLDDGDAIARIVERDAGSLLVACAYLPFAWHGVRSARLARAVARSVRLVRFDSAFGQLCLAVTCERLGVRSPWSVRASLVRALRALRDRRQTVQRAYELSHLAFFVTDLGARPEAFPPGAQRWVGRALAGWTKVWLRGGDFDLAAEMIATAACIGACDDEPRELLPALWRAQRRDGVVPHYASRPAGRGAARFREGYHATIAAVTATVLWERG